MVANRQKNLPKSLIATAPASGMATGPGCVKASPPPTFAPLDPLRRPLRSPPPAALTTAPVKVTPVLPSQGDDAVLARPAGDVTAVPANPAGIRPDGALPLGTAVTPSPQVPRAIHEVNHVQP